MAFQLLARATDPANGQDFVIEVDGPLHAGSTRVVDRYDQVRVTNLTTKPGAAIVRNRSTGAEVLAPIIIQPGTAPTVVDLTSFSVAQRTQNVIDSRWPA